MTELVRSGKRLAGLLSLVLCVTVLASAFPMSSVPSHSVLAEELALDDLTAQKDALAAEQEHLAAQRSETASSLEEQKEQAEIIRKQIDAKSSEIAINQQLLSELDTAINEKVTTIAEQDATIASLEAQITDQQYTLRVRLREVSKKSSFATVVQLLLNSKSCTDYLIGFKLSERISTRNEQLMAQIEQNITTLETAKNQNTTEKASLEIKRTQAAQVQTELETGKAELQQLYDEANAVADAMYENIEYLDEQIAAMEEQQASLQGNIDAVMEQIRQEEEAKRLEEEERRRQEEEKRREEEESDSSDSSEDSDSADDSSSDDSYDDSYEEDTSGDDYEDDRESDSSDDTASVESMLWPAPTCRVITSSFKYREQFDRWHNGLDIACYGDAEGEPIVAAAAGQVRYVNRYDEWGGGYGLYMMIDHGYDSEGRRIITIYAHCSEVLVYEGLEVEAGEIIGYVGDTGNSYGAHLHFEVQADGVAIDPVSNGFLSTEWIDVLG